MGTTSAKEKAIMNAEHAARHEKMKLYPEAAEYWKLAFEFAPESKNVQWWQIRHKYCLNRR